MLDHRFRIPAIFIVCNISHKGKLKCEEILRTFVLASLRISLHCGLIVSPLSNTVYCELKVKLPLCLYKHYAMKIYGRRDITTPF
jgi:hypothetical protein